MLHKKNSLERGRTELRDWVLVEERVDELLHERAEHSEAVRPQVVVRHPCAQVQHQHDVAHHAPLRGSACVLEPLRHSKKLSDYNTALGS